MQVKDSLSGLCFVKSASCFAFSSLAVQFCLATPSVPVPIDRRLFPCNVRALHMLRKVSNRASSASAQLRLSRGNVACRTRTRRRSRPLVLPTLTAPRGIRRETGRRRRGTTGRIRPDRPTASRLSRLQRLGGADCLARNVLHLDLMGGDRGGSGGRRNVSTGLQNGRRHLRPWIRRGTIPITERCYSVRDTLPPSPSIGGALPPPVWGALGL